ncbi:hypothetical protein [Klebsiella pneumoniae]|uniref:hypothetical protein n=1 Tax=Klebsiella pneumoniae TaxID=573 RepID=UPI000E2AE05A|nr:hypothetical protein [Klebsiella pneumoniae]SVK85518.1 Uncharacterised protein [Klebsiella pneumoniae]SYV76221.1 Uncharacterised protein [Klebsiella pneumoniae]
MNNSITRERLEALANAEYCKSNPGAWLLGLKEVNELARMALAAMDSESGCLPLDYLQGHKDGLEWAAQLAEANHPETGDWLYDDPIELAKAIRKGPDIPPAQPVADSDPVIIVGDDGGDALSYRRLIQSFEPGTKLYRHPQPAPVVPDDVLNRLEHEANHITAWHHMDEHSCKVNRRDLLTLVNACRAAMLQAGTLTNEGTKQAWTGIPDIDNAINMLDRIDTLESCDDDRIEAVKTVLRGLAGNSPVIPDGYVMVPMRLTAENGAKGALSGEFSETKFVNCPECFGDDECETCDGSGKIEITVPVTWTTIKAIWVKGVEHFAVTAQEND